MLDPLRCDAVGRRSFRVGDAPRVFVSYSHESPEHEERVLRLADALLAKGVNCMLDQYEPVFAEGLQRWMRDRIRESDFVLVVCTETYFRRHMGLERPGEGKGVIFESGLILQDAYETGYLNEKIIPVYFGGGRDFILPELRSALSYRLDTDDGFEALLRRLTRQPAVVKPPLGSIPELPPRTIRPGDRPSPAAEPTTAQSAPAVRSSRRVWMGAAGAAAPLVAAAPSRTFVRYVVGFSVGVGIGLAPFLGKVKVPGFEALISLFPRQLQNTLLPLAAFLMGVIAVAVQFYAGSHLHPDRLGRYFGIGLVVMLSGFFLFAILCMLFVRQIPLREGEHAALILTPERLPGCSCGNLPDALCVQKLSFNRAMLETCWGGPALKAREVSLEISYLLLTGGFGALIGLLLLRRALPAVPPATPSEPTP